MRALTFFSPVTKLCRGFRLPRHAPPRVAAQRAPDDPPRDARSGASSRPIPSPPTPAARTAACRSARLAHVCRRSCQRKWSIPARASAAYQALVLSCTTGFPRKLNTCVGCSPICLRTIAIASPLSGTAIALRAFAWSGCTHAICRAKSTCCHCRPLTFAARKPVASENAAMSARCSGNSARSRCASPCVRNRKRRVGSLSIRT